MIIVTGATGRLGQLIVEKLLTQVPPNQLGVSVRDPAKAAHWKERGVRVRFGDFSNPASLLSAFEGASQLLLISSNTTGETAVEHHSNAINAAKAVSVGRILYTSHMGANVTSASAPMRDHAATEAMLQSSGLTFTSLRNGFYGESAIMLMGPFLQTGTIATPADGVVSWTDHRDLADAAVFALTQDEKLNGLTPPLTSSQALDLAGLAQIASEVTGREIKRLTIPDEQYHANLLSYGTPEFVADLLRDMFKASRNNEFATVDPTLASLLGRPPLSMCDVLTNHLSNNK